MSLLNTDKDPRHAIVNPMSEGMYRIIPLAAVILGFAVVAFNYGALPETVPIHYNGKGEADGFGSKLFLWILPVINLVIFYMLELTTKSSFKWFNYPVAITEENAAAQHRIALQLVAVMRLIITLMLSWLTYEIVATTQKGSGTLNRWILGGSMVALFGAIIYYMMEANKAK
ncbi:DUF1648 domain-containing protein [Neolewinella agarilytica]|uniref:DUF1648 domain-containing protein n=1 Tax=Neolewinella agarilytica TaxID=478744 RepID=A0A1H9IZP4_9BACT|nr:DUF1648 domain-containing protein [Neolewinella agarilytica]SEQ80070.1 Protein of unknown function [Neolewinella agarilytica]